MAVEVIGDSAPDGVTLGRAAAEKVSTYGVTPVIQSSGANQAAAGTTASTTTSPAGFANTTQANATINLVDEMRTALVNFGVMKGSA